MVRQVEEIAALNKLIMRSIVDHAVVTMDADGIITSWNEGAERILGWTEEEIVGRSADVFFTDADTAENRPETEMRLAIENGRAEDVRWHVRKNGERFWGSGLMMPLLKASNASGEAVQDPRRIQGFVKIFRDRTSERDANLRMARLQDRATLAMRRSGTVGVFDNDLVNDIVVGDHTCARLHSVDVQLAESGTGADSFFAGVVPEDQEKARAALMRSSVEGSDLDIVYRVRADGPRPIWVQSQGTVRMDDSGRPLRLTGIVVDVTEQQEHLRMQEARLEFGDKVRDMTDAVEIAELASRVIGETVYATRVGHGYVAEDGDTIDIRADWNTQDSQSLVGRHRYSDFGSFAEVLRDGRTVVMGDVEDDPRVEDAAGLRALGIRALINLPLIQQGRLAAVLFVNDARPRTWREAEITFLGAMFDRTYAAIDKLHLQAEAEVLADELVHRMKNILTVVQIVVKQSLRNVPDIREERDAIVDRLQSLSSAQDILTRANNRDADILSVIETTLSPHLPQPERISISGPSLPLSSQQVLGLSLALHELATNAAKYGALSNNDGVVELAWSLDEGAFEFRWTERNGPPVTPTHKTGFGSTILQRVAGSYFNGTSALTLERDGAVFRITGNLAA